jgi:prolipoprotein diacylglyceryltransferase
VSLTYSLIIAAALGVGFLAARLTQSRLPMSGRDKLGICLGAYVGAMLGAKLPFVLSDWDGFVSGVAWFSSGKTILCGLVGGYFGVEIAKWTLDLRVKTGDTFAVPVPLSIAVGRLGCFFAGCCYGTPTDLPWGVVFPAVDAAARHPTQLYETVFHLACACGLAVLRDRGLFRGQLIKLYIIVYAGYRFATETIRPEARLWHGFTGYQGAALLIMVLFAWLWRHDARAIASARSADDATKFVPSG